jgi:nucleobase:cation symporter-1, NCS1 family
VPKALSFVDQLGLWGNLGVSLLGFTGAIFVLQPNGSGTPELSLAAGLTAIVVGTLLGTVPMALSGVVGTRTGAPAMVLLRGLFGARLSYLPTALNILQCLGWGIFELVTIATAAHTVAPSLPRWAYILIAGVVTGALAVHPLGFIRTLRRYVTVAVVIVLAYLFIELARHPLPAFTHGSWSGYWAATDTVVAAAISFAPMAADYSRHSRTERAAFGGALVGYSFTQILCYVIGLLALVTVARNPNDIYAAFIALPAGTIGFAILAARELDQSFANVYSTAVSTQNLRPLWDRRVLAVAIAAIATAGALFLNIDDYENFLVLLGSVFVPMSAVLIVDFFVISRGQWDLSDQAPSRWPMLVAWAAGFVTYQLINPGYISWWVSAWGWVAHQVGFSVESWMSASILSFVVAALATLVVRSAAAARRHLSRRPPDREPLSSAV